MQNYGDSVNEDTNADKLVTKDSPFTQEMTGVDFAVGLQTLNNYDPHYVDTYGYVEYEVFQNSYAFDSEGGFSQNPVVLSQHNCTKDDLETRFNGGEFKELFYNLQCLDDPSALSFYGGYTATYGRGVFFHVNKCVGKPHCKSETEINEFLADKTLLLMYNQS